MNASYQTAAAASDLFAHADGQYATLKEALTSVDFQSKTEAEVQRWLVLRGRLLDGHHSHPARWRSPTTIARGASQSARARPGFAPCGRPLRGPGPALRALRSIVSGRWATDASGGGSELRMKGGQIACVKFTTPPSDSLGHNKNRT